MQTRYDFKARKKAFLVRCKALDDPEWENTVLHSASLIQRFLDEDIQKGDAIRVGISLSQLVHGHYPSSLLAYGRSDGQDAQGIWQQLRLLELAVNLTVQQYREENETVYDGCVPGLHEWLALYGWAWGVGNEDLADAIAALLHNYVVSNNLRSELQESHLVEWLAPLMAAQLTGSWPAVEDVTDAMGPFRWLMDGIADPVLWPEALMMYCDFRLGRSERYTYPDSKRRTIDVHPMSIFENHSFSVVPFELVLLNGIYRRATGESLDFNIDHPVLNSVYAKIATLPIPENFTDPLCERIEQFGQKRFGKHWQRNYRLPLIG